MQRPCGKREGGMLQALRDRQRGQGLEMRGELGEMKLEP